MSININHQLLQQYNQQSSFRVVYNHYYDIMNDWAGVMVLTELLYIAYNPHKPENIDGFQITNDQLTERARVSKRELMRAKNRLQNLGIFTTTHNNTTASTNYHLNPDVLVSIIVKVTQKPKEFSCPETYQPVGSKRTNQLVQNVPTINTSNIKNNIEVSKLSNTVECSETVVENSSTKSANQPDCKSTHSNPSILESKNESQPTNQNPDGKKTSDPVARLNQFCDQMLSDEFQLAKIAKDGCGKLLDTHDLITQVNRFQDYYNRKPEYAAGNLKVKLMSWFNQSLKLDSQKPTVSHQDKSKQVLPLDTDNQSLVNLQSRKSMLESKIDILRNNPNTCETLLAQLDGVNKEIQEVENRIKQSQTNKMFDAN